MDFKNWLKKNRYSYRTFAKELEISHYSVFNWASKKKKPSRHMAKMIEIFTKGEVKAKELLNQEPWSKNDRSNDRGKARTLESPEKKR